MANNLESLSYVFKKEDINLELLYHQICYLRKNWAIDWNSDDLSTLKKLYLYIANLEIPDDKDLARVYKNILLELTFIETKIKIINSYLDEVKIDKEEINKIFSKNYYDFSIYNLLKILYLQISCTPELINERLLTKIVQKLSKMVVFSKSQAKLALKLLGKIDHIDTPDLRVSLTKIKKYLADSSFKIKIDYLLDSNYQLKDFETFFKNMDDIAPRGLDKLEILPKISIVLKESDIDEEKKQEYHRKIEILKKDILNNLSAFEKINLDIISGKIVLANEFPHYQLNYTKPTSYFEEIILTIDEAISLDLDGAFQIKEQGDLYILDVYITDVPSFLMTNDTLFWEAYKRGSSCYAHFADKQLAVNMLPVELANNLLSLRQETVHRVIDFTFIIGKKGQIYDTKLSFKDIKILKNIPLQKRKVLLLILTI